MKVDQLQKNVQHISKQVQVQTSKPLGKGPHEGKSTKKEQKPVKQEWLVNHTPLKLEVIKQYCEWNGTKWYWCCEENGGKCGGAWHAHLPSQCKGFSKHSKNKKLPAKKDRTGTKRKSDALKLSTVNKAIVEAAQWENNDEQEHDYTLDAEYQEM